MELEEAALVLLAVAALVYGAALASDAGCRWVTDLLNTTQMGLTLDLAFSNSSSPLSGALGELLTPQVVRAATAAQAAGDLASLPNPMAHALDEPDERCRRQVIRLQSAIDLYTLALCLHRTLVPPASATCSATPLYRPVRTLCVTD